MHTDFRSKYLDEMLKLRQVVENNLFPIQIVLLDTFVKISINGIARHIQESQMDRNMINYHSIFCVFGKDFINCIHVT